MNITWIGLLFEIIILYFIQAFITDFEVTAIVFIGIHIFFVSFGLIKYNKQRLILISAYFVRILAMFWDIYMSHIFTFPNSGGDAVGYYLSSAAISKDLSLLKENVYGGLYSKIVGILYYVTAPERLIGQYINVMIGLTTIITVYKILQILEIDKKLINIVILVISFFPNAIIFSAIHLRESIVAFLVTFSFYYFIKWYKNKSCLTLIYSIIIILVASSFHSGVIGIAIGYVFSGIFYKHNINKYRLTKNSIPLFVFFILISCLIYSKFNSVFLVKFENINEIESLYRVANKRFGRTAYLTSLNIDSGWKMIVFSPVKMFYFLTSPLPFNWGNFNDMLTFFIDSIFYIFMIIFSFKNYKKVKDIEPILLGILVLLISVIVIFGVGVSNAGTAMRHRYKIMPIILVFYTLIAHRKKKIIKDQT